jgi:uncharacterized protein YndB with AHSA1/START domain
MVQQDSALKVTTPSDTEVVMSRSFSAPRALVFEALTNPEHIRRWLGRNEDQFAVCEVDFRVGGEARFVWQMAPGDMGITWVFQEIVQPQRFAFSETFDEPYHDVMGGTTANVWALEESGDKTLFTGTTTYKSREERDQALGTGMGDGAAESFDRLAELLDTLQQ